MIRVGVTGTIGAGKSSVGRLFEAWGARRIDADALARQAVRPGSRALDRIRATWGDGVLLPGGELDRAALRRLVFADPEARRRLEAIVHPAIEALRVRALEEARAAGTDLVVAEIPLLYEKGLEGEFDLVIVVDAPVEERRRRVGLSRRLTPDEFDAMDAVQWTGARKRSRADVVIWNDGDEAALERSARAAWERVERLRKGENGPTPRRG
ncbi:MAG: dephospho-CoA kinase [Gemmatimonadota bacterium]